MQSVVDAVTTAFSAVTDNRYIQALLLFLFAVFIAWIVDLAVSRFLRALASRSKTEIDDRFIHILHRPIIVTVVLIGLTLATYRLQLGSGVESFTLSALNTIGIVVWTIFLLRFSDMFFASLSRSPRIEIVQHSTLPLFSNGMRILVVVGAVYAGFRAWGRDVAALLAGAGIVGLALSFAAKDTLSNLFAGVSILADRPYQIGDFINLDSGERGQVTQIGLRSTRILTRDDVEVTIPNSVMGNAKIVNESGGPHVKYRVRVPIGVAYGSDIDLVQRVLLKVADEHTDVCKRPERRVRFRVFGNSSLDFELLVWIPQPVQRGKVLHELNCTIYKRFAAEGIEIPFPQRDVHIKQTPEQLQNAQTG